MSADITIATLEHNNVKQEETWARIHRDLPLGYTRVALQAGWVFGILRINNLWAQQRWIFLKLEMPYSDTLGRRLNRMLADEALRKLGDDLHAATWDTMQDQLAIYRERVFRNLREIDDKNDSIRYLKDIEDCIRADLETALLQRHPTILAPGVPTVPWSEINIPLSWCFPMFPDSRIKTLRPIPIAPNLSEPDPVILQEDMTRWVREKRKFEQNMHVPTYEAMVEAAEKRNEDKRTKYNDPEATITAGSYEYTPREMNQFERQKTILQANALANDLPEPVWDDEDFLFRGGNEDLFVTKKFMAFIHGKLRDPNLSLTAKRLYHFFNRNDISEYLRFPRAQFWEQVALDRWFKPHKFNLDRLLLIQFFMGNGLHGNWAKELTLSPYSFARSLCRKLKLPPIFETGDWHKYEDYDKAAHKQVDHLITMNNYRHYKYYNIRRHQVVHKRSITIPDFKL